MTDQAPSTADATSTWLPFAPAAFAIVIFMIDANTRGEIAVSVLYVAVVLLAARFFRARDVLLTQAIASEESLDAAMPTEDLLTLDGMSPDLALALARRGVRSLADLADLAVDDLADIEGLSPEEAGSLIMKARAPLFEAANHG